MATDISREAPSPRRYAGIVGGMITLILLGGFYLWLVPARPITVDVDGVPISSRTRVHTVAQALTELGLTLRPQDEVEPARGTPLRDHMHIVVRRARPIILDIAGRRRLVYVRARSLGEALKAAGVTVRPGDEVRLDGHLSSLKAALPAIVREPIAGKPSWQWPVRPLEITLKRAIPLLVDDDGMTFTIYTTAPTVGRALHQAGVEVYLGDEVRPALGEPVSAYMRITLLRSTPVVIEVDGQTLQTRTRARRVADLLAEQGIFLKAMDRVQPALTASVYPNMRVKVTRVSEFVQVEDERIPYETSYVPDDALEIDHRRLVTAGRPGIFRRRFRVVMQDGLQVSRVLEDAWVAQTPITHVIAYGRKIITRTLKTPDGTITYWRRVRLLATSYSASTAGVDPSRPWYGVTRLGFTMRKGLVAVDPRVIPLGSKVYVPGYGVGLAADTGSRILGRRIDLGYDDWNLVLWNNWVDVYLLAPPPPKRRINYLLPNWPRPPR